MGISSYTNFTGLSGVTVHSRGSDELISSAVAVSGDPSANRLKVTVYTGGTFSGNAGSNGVINIHSGGSATNGYVTNHTVQNVLYGGVARNCTYGSNNGSVSGISAIPESTVVSSAETITNGVINRVGYVTSTIAVNNVVTFKMANNARAAGSTIIENNGTVVSGTIEDGGKIFIEKGGKASSIIVNGAGRVDVNGGYVNTVVESNGYSTSQIDSHGTILTNSRIIVSATYGIPTSGYSETSDGSAIYNNVWYPASRYDNVSAGDMTGGVANIMTVVSNTNRASASCVLNGTGTDWTAINGTYSLLIKDNKNIDSWFMSARNAEWKNVNISSPTHYYAIEYATHTDGYPYWDLNEVTSSYDSDSKLVVSKVLKAFAPSYRTVKVPKQADANTARIPGPEFNILSDGVANNINIPAYGHATVNSCGMISAGIIGNYGDLTVNKFGIAGLAAGMPITISSAAKFVLNIPGSSVKKYISGGVLIPDHESSKYLSNGSPITGVSTIYAPCVYTHRMNSAGTSAGGIGISGTSSGTVAVAGIVAMNNDIVYTNSGVTINAFSISSGGRVLLNAGVSGLNGNIYTGGTLNVMDSAYCICTVNNGGTIKLDPYASGSTTVSAGGNISCTISRMINCATVNGQTGTLGYAVFDVVGVASSWIKTSGVTTLNLTSANSTTIGYDIISGSSEYAGVMLRKLGTGDSSIDSSIIYLANSSNATTPRFGIIDTSDTLQVVQFDANLISSTIIGTAIISNHNLKGLTYSEYSVADGVNCNIDITDKVNIGTFSATNPASCFVNFSGDVIVSSLVWTNATDASLQLVGFENDTAIGKHIPEVDNINANSGFILYAGTYASACTVPLVSQTLSYAPITLSCTLTPVLETNLNLIQGSNYQIVSTVYETGTPTSAVGVGINVINDGYFIVGKDAYVYGMNVGSGNSVNIQSDGRAIGTLVNENATLNVDQAGKLYQPVALGDNANVVAARLATCEFTGTEKLALYRRAIVNGNVQCEHKFATLSKAYTAPTDVTSATYFIYEQMTPIVAGLNLHQSAKYNATEAFWYGAIDTDYTEHKFLSAATSGHSANMTIPIMFSNTASYVTFTHASNATKNHYWYYDGGTNNFVVIESANSVWKMNRYVNNAMTTLVDSEVLPSAYRLFYSSSTLSTGAYFIEGCTSAIGTFGDITCKTVTSARPIMSGLVSLYSAYSSSYYTHINRTPIGLYIGDSPATNFSMISYTDGYAIKPVVDKSVHYQVQDNTIISGLLTADNNGIAMDVYREGRDAENNVASSLYHHTDSWVNSATNATFYDSGMVATYSGKLVVASRTLVGPTVLSGGYIEVYGGANIRNITQERMGVVNVAFNRGKFSVEGQCVRISSAMSGKIDENVNIYGSALTGDTSTYMLTMEDNLSSGDNRCWKNTFVTTSDVYSISKNLALAIGAYNGTGHNVWKLTITKDTNYTDPIAIFRSAISSGTGSPENTLLQDATWITGNVKFAANGVMSYGNASACKMVKVTYTGSDVVVPAGVSNASRVSAYASDNPTFSALFVDSANANYLMATSGIYINVLYYDSTIDTYVPFDTLNGIMSHGGSTVTDTKYLENVGHTRDPWWIYCVDSNGSTTDLNTANPAYFSSGYFISRVNTVNFLIADKTSDVTVFRQTSGATVERITSATSAYLTHDDAYIGTSGTVNVDTLCTVKNSVLKGGYINFYNKGALDNITVDGAYSIIRMAAIAQGAYINNVNFKSNAVLSLEGWRGMNDGVVNVASARTISGSNFVVPKVRFNMSGCEGLYCSLVVSKYYNGDYQSCGRAYSGGCGMLEDWIYIGANGYFNTPYLLCKHIGGEMGNNKELQYENYDLSSAHCSLVFDHNSNTNNISGNYWSGTPYKAIAKGYIVSSGEVASFGRSLTALDVVSKAGASFVRSDVGTWTYSGSRCVRAWITPWLSAVRTSANMDYYNTTPAFKATDFTVVSTYAAVNSTFNAPTISSATTATIAASNYNYYLYTNHPAAMTIASAIVHVKPGTVIGETGGVTMGLSGALYVDAHAIAMDVDIDSSVGTIPVIVGNATVNMQKTRFQQVRAMNEGIIIAKPNASHYFKYGSDNTDDVAANVGTRIIPAQGIGTGKVLWGKTKGYNSTTKWGYGIPTSFVESTTVNELTDAATQDVFVFSNVSATNAAGTALRNMIVYSTHALYLGSNSVLSCAGLYLYEGATLIIDKGAKLTTNTVSIANNVTIICMDSSFDFNEKSGNGTKFNFGYNDTIKYMSGFDITKVPNNSTRIANATNSAYWMPTAFYMYQGYDLPNNDKNRGNVYFYKNGTNTVGASTYNTYSGIGLNSQVFTVSYASGLTDPSTGSTFEGWVVDGMYEPYADCDSSERVSGHLYACKHKNLIGFDWIRMSGRYSIPYTACGGTMQHVGKDLKIYDCGRTAAAAIDYTSIDYPTIEHVNGVVTGTVTGKPILGQAGIISSVTTISNGKKVTIRDFVDHNNTFSGVTCSGNGHIAFGGCSILDNVSNDSIKITTVTGTPTNCMFTMNAGKYQFNVDDPATDTVATVDYDYINNTSAGANCTIPFVIKKATISGPAGAGKLYFMQPMSNVVIEDTSAVTMATTYDLDVKDGAEIAVEGKLHKTRVTGATMIVSGYVRNISAGQGAVIRVLETGSCDNILLGSGATLYVSGYITGYENSGGVISGAVDSKHIRTENIFTKDYTWE